MHVPGPAQRFWEHLLHVRRPELKGSSLGRYRRFRQTSVHGMGFLICRAGPDTMVSAAEIVEIRRHCPEANALGNPQRHGCRQLA